MSAFNKVVYLYDELKEDYERQGFSDNSEELLTSYKNAFNFLKQNLKFKFYLINFYREIQVFQLDFLFGD